jgi:Cu/Ag efflux protein CusF
MKKSLYRAVAGVILTSLFSLGVYSFASAQQEPGGPGGRGGDPSKRVMGKVAAIGSNSITVEKRDGAQEVITVTGDTEYSRNRQPASLSDFKAGDFVAAHGSRNDGGQFTAERVMGGDQPPPGRPGRGPRRGHFNGVGGEAQAIDQAARTITVKDREGNTQVIYTNDNTEFNRNRQPATLQDFKAGDRVGAEGARDADGKFIAGRVFGGDRKAPRN